jgi:fatty acid desaturase
MTSAHHGERPYDDSVYGGALLILFIAPALIVTATVGLLAFIPTWWMLVIVFGAVTRGESD